MATRVKGKIGKRLERRRKAGKSTSLAIGPGAAGALGKGLKAVGAAAKARIAARSKAKPVKAPDTRTLAQRRGLVGDLTKIPNSQLSAADLVRKGTQIARKRLRGGVTSKRK